MEQTSTIPSSLLVLNISSSATVEILGQNINSKQQDDRTACQFTVIFEIKQKNY